MIISIYCVALNRLYAQGNIDSMNSKDSNKKELSFEAKYGIKVSKDEITSRITTKAKDSSVIHIADNKFYLYGNAETQYEDMDIKAGIIEFSQKSGLVNARALRDSNNKVISKQNFTRGSETFTYEEMNYNMNSKRAIVKNARSQYGEGFVLSEQIKRNSDETIYGLKNLYTTCDLDTPHFGIRARKIKIVPGKVIATGSANLEFEGIPTPLYLPFGLFPVQEKQSSGFILPSYTIEARRGVGLQRGGYYFSLGKYLGTTLQMDFFSKGSWAALVSTQYAKRYQYSGNFQFGYNYTKTGVNTDPNAVEQTDFRITWSHQQDQKARPGTNFSANVNIISSNDYNKLNGGNMYAMMQNSFSSSISYNKTWVGKPFALSAALRHDQNTQTGLVTMTLPDVNFSVGSFNPFQFNKNGISNKWYEKITTSYNVNLSNRIAFTDSLFSFNQLRLTDFNNAIRHTVNISASYNILKYFNLSFGIPYTEFWNTKKYLEYYDDARGGIDTLNESGFFATRQFSATASLSTRIYGMKMFKKGKIAGIRHVVMPSIGTSYFPGFAQSPFNYFEWAKLRQNDIYDYRSPYTNSIYNPLGGPTNTNPVGSVNFSINNTLAMKVRKDDTGTTQNVNIIDRLSITSSYNMFADSNNLAPISFNMGNTIKEYITISVGATYDAYKWRDRRRTSEYLLSTDGKLARFQSGNVSLGFNYRSKKSDQERYDEEVDNNEELNRLVSNDRYNDYYDFNVPFDIRASYSMNAARNYFNSDDGEVVVNHSLTFGGQMQLTENWRLSIESGYNFTQKQMSITSINISRDLHCWQMMFNVIPFGQYRSFNFTINAKSSILQDLKLIKRKSYLDN